MIYVGCNAITCEPIAHADYQIRPQRSDLHDDLGSYLPDDWYHPHLCWSAIHSFLSGIHGIFILPWVSLSLWTPETLRLIHLTLDGELQLQLSSYRSNGQERTIGVRYTALFCGSLVSGAFCPLMAAGGKKQAISWIQIPSEERCTP
jgi:hypothetical protein